MPPWHQQSDDALLIARTKLKQGSLSTVLGMEPGLENATWVVKVERHVERYLGERAGRMARRGAREAELIAGKATGRVRAAAWELLSGGSPGVEREVDLGDPGLMGPGSVSWQILSDPSSLVGGVRALLKQAAHPRVVQGVIDHSAYETDTVGRLNRTVWFVSATTFGSTREARMAAEIVKRAHRVVNGVTSEGEAYDANDPHLLEWVHLCLVESLLVSYREFGSGVLSEGDEDRFVEEQARAFMLLSESGTARSVRELHARLDAYKDEMRNTVACREAVRFILKPNLPGVARAPYSVLLAAAIGSLDAHTRVVLCVREVKIPKAAVRAATSAFLDLWRGVIGEGEASKIARERARESKEAPSA